MVSSRERRYVAKVRWEGNRGAGTADYAAYDRGFSVAVAGKSDLAGSADPLFRGDPALHNPEDLLLAALASCHMLTYLALCARAGIVVTAYSDEATAALELRPGGDGAFTGATLRPRVQVVPGTDSSAAAALHERAAELCFIARSVGFPVRHEPTIEVSPTQRETAP